MQEEIIEAILQGNDVLALLPTGGGKSICFQVPAMAREGICLVVSPLIALMKDQVEGLRRRSITAFAIYSGMSRKEVITTLKTASGSNCKFLYVSPERLETRLFLEYLPALNVNLIAVDEAHCISQWGYDFRPPYLRISALREELPDVPVLALTASATRKVQLDICEKLQFKNEKIFRQSFERPKLSYSVFNTPAKIIKLTEILKKVQGTGIVYCKSRKRTREISEQLNAYGIHADYYHAGLSADERNSRQESWIKNQVRVIVCTNAFGMGIDKPDVRTVVHYDMPDSIENYYQEAGRAGRDTLNAFAVLLYQDKDLEQLKEQVELRFPGLENIRVVYQSLMNYLQLPTETGEGNYYDFDLADFAGKFKLAPQLVVNALKALEQEGRLSFSETIFVSAKVGFTCNKEMLYQFEKDKPAFEPVIKTLLRSYEGIFDQEVNIQEKSIAHRLKKELAEVKQLLTQLAQYKVISYQPVKDTPQIYFLQNRVKGENLQIDLQRYNERKKAYKIRIEAMIGYAHQQECRSQLIGNYFGDEAIKPCGICDNCLRKKSGELSQEEFSRIENQILTALRVKPVHSKLLLEHINGFKKEKAWQVIAFLQSEKKILVSGTGMISLNGK
jgi:ATP-dependent DNA helicase RecQ